MSTSLDERERARRIWRAVVLVILSGGKLLGLLAGVGISALAAMTCVAFLVMPDANLMQAALWIVRLTGADLIRTDNVTSIFLARLALVIFGGLGVSGAIDFSNAIEKWWNDPKLPPAKA